MADETGHSGDYLLSLGVDFDPSVWAQLQAALNLTNEKVSTAAKLMEDLASSSLKAKDGFAQLVLQTAQVDKTAEAVKRLDQELNSAALEAMQLSEELQGALAQVSGSFDNIALATRAEVEEIDALAEAFRNENLQAEVEKMEAFADATRMAEEAEADLAARLETLQGLSPTGAGPGGGEGGEGGGRVGSAFGIGHALSVAGHALGSPALGEAGAAIYMEEGARRAIPIFTQLNEKLLESGGIVPALTEGFAALGIPMAGIVATALPIVLVLADLAMAFIAFRNATTDLAEAEKKRFDQQTELLARTQAAWKEAETKTPQQAQKGLSDGLQSREILIGQLNDLRTRRADTNQKYADLGSSVNPVERERLRRLGNQQDDEITGLLTQIDKLNQAYNTQTKILIPTVDLNTRIRENQAAQAAAVEEQLQLHQKMAADNKLTAKAAEEKINALKQEGASQQAAADGYKVLNAHLDQNSDQFLKNAEAIKEHEKAAQSARDEIAYLTNTVLPAAQAAEYLAEGIKNLKKSLEDAAKEAAAQASRIGDAVAGFNKAQADAQTQLANQTENATAREKQAEEQYHRGSLQDIYERTRIGLEEGRKELEAAQANADKIADVNLNLYEKQYEIGLNYQQQVEDDQTKLNNNLGKIAREGQYQAQEDAIDHQAKMAQLRERDIVADTQNLLDRNFKALYLAGLHKEQEARKEESDFAAKEAQQQRHRQQAASEAVIAAQQERQQQQVNYLRKMDDARRQAANEIVQADIAEQRKIQALRLAEQQKLTDLTTSENFKIQVLRKNLQNEIVLYQQQERQRIEIARTTMSVIIADALAQIAKIGTQNTVVNTGLGLAGGAFGALRNILFKDSGGSFDAGEPFMKGPITEGFDFGGGRGFALGGGSALVFPLRGGTATPQGGGMGNIHFAPVINMPAGSDPEYLVQRLRSEFMDVLDEVQN